MKTNLFKSIFISLILLVVGATNAWSAKVYLKPNSNWTQSNARFAAYFFGNGEKWVSMTANECDPSIYECDIPTGYPNVILCRMNPSATANNWNNKWNQTLDLTVPKDDNCLYTVKDGTWDKGGGTWTPYYCYLKGSFNEWGTTNPFINGSVAINLTAGDYTFKIHRHTGDSELWCGNDGTMDRDNCTNWEMRNDKGNCTITASPRDIRSDRTAPWSTPRQNEFYIL